MIQTTETRRRASNLGHLRSDMAQMSQDDVARRLGITRQLVWHYERRALAKLRKALADLDPGRRCA